MLESSRARQTRSGTVTVGDVTLRSSLEQPAWLYVSPSGDTVVAACHGPEPAGIELDLPSGQVSLDSARSALITWTRDGVTLDTIGLQGEPRIDGNRLVSP